MSICLVFGINRYFVQYKIYNCFTYFQMQNKIKVENFIKIKNELLLLK